MRRVVITGLGIVSCLGNNQDEVHQSLLNSKSGISFAEEYKEHNLKSHVHGKPNLNTEEHVDRKILRFMGEGAAYNHIAMQEAIEHSGLDQSLVSNPNKEIKSLISWLDWQWEDSYLSPHLNKRSVLTASSVEVRSPINSKSIGGWKNYKDMLKPAIEILTKTNKYKNIIS